jgi:hypothetical protein
LQEFAGAADASSTPSSTASGSLRFSAGISLCCSDHEKKWVGCEI